jgi:membrane protease YdiL (CAAX protease family)
MNRPIPGALLLMAVAAGMFAASGWISSLAPLSMMNRQVLFKALLLAASITAMAAWRPEGADWGLRRAKNVRWFRVLAPALAMGALASIVILSSGGSGLQAALGPMRFWQVVLVIWIWSSLSEEIFTRSWLQGALHRWREVKVGRIAFPAAFSAIAFGAMHLSLFWKGVDTVTAASIVIFATALGLWAGVLRERYNSVSPALAAHVGFNIGGAVGGVLFVIAYRITTGHLPPQVGTP